MLEQRDRADIGRRPTFVRVTLPAYNESESLGIGDLTIENRTDRISIYGNIDLTRFAALTSENGAP